MGNSFGQFQSDLIKDYPPFDRNEPAEWFTEIEEHFAEFNVFSDEAKCEILIDELDWDILQFIENYEMCNPDYDGDQRYERIKRIILQTLR